jgi:hypothetical protein
MLLADDSHFLGDFSAAVAVVAVAVAVITFLAMWLWRARDRQSKMLDYLVISDTDIVSTHHRPEKLKVVYGQEEVKDPRVTEIRFKNTGKQVIETDDFIEPVIMRRPNSRILDFDVVEESDNHLVDKIEIVMPEPDTPDPDTPHPDTADPDTAEHVRLVPRTLNSGDWFTVQLVYDGGGSSSDMVFTTRIRGQTRKIAAFTPESDVVRRRMRVSMAIAGLVLAVILTCASIVSPFGTVFKTALLLAAFGCLVLGSFGLFALITTQIALISTRRRERA